MGWLLKCVKSPVGLANIKLAIFWELITQPMALMIWLAAAVEGCISNWPDMFILIGINLANSLISFKETIEAGDAVAALKAGLRPVATCRRDGKWSNIDASELVPGDLVLLATQLVDEDLVHGDRVGAQQRAG